MSTRFLLKDGLMSLDDFDIEWLIERCKDRFTVDIITKSVTGLVDKGLIEQYIDENGDFKFTLTEFGRRVANKLEEDGFGSFWDED